MEKKIQCYFLLSLKEIALRRFAVILSKRRQISTFTLPPSLRKEMSPILRGIESEISEWKSNHKRYLGIGSHAVGKVYWNDLGLLDFQKMREASIRSEIIDGRVLQKLCWTTAGAIDYRKTAETLARSGVINSRQRFEMACLYCLEDSFPALWKEQPEGGKRRYSASRSQLGTSPFYSFLFSEIDNRFLPLRESRRDRFKYAVTLGNKAAAEYFFKNLSGGERWDYLLNTAMGVLKMYGTDTTIMPKRPDVLCYLLSRMTAREQLHILRKRPCDVLMWFIDWPWHDLFLAIADVIWTFLENIQFADLLRRIKSHIEKTKYYHPKFFRAFFLRMPMKFRKYFVNREGHYAYFFTEFFWAEDFDTIQEIFGSIDAADKKRLMFSTGLLRLFDNFLQKEKGNIVEKCVEIAELSKEEKVFLKKDFSDFVKINDSGMESDLRENKRKGFFEFLDGIEKTTEEKLSRVEKSVQ